MVADNRNIDNFWASHYFNLVRLCDRKPNEANNKPSEVNENMNYLIYIQRMKPDDEAMWCVLRQSLMFRSFGPDSQIEMMAIVHFPCRENMACFSPSNAVTYALNVGKCDDSVCTKLFFSLLTSHATLISATLLVAFRPSSDGTNI